MSDSHRTDPGEDRTPETVQEGTYDATPELLE
jgi:hypothetical protein